MQCRMPVLSLPDELIEQLENSTSETISSTQGPGVAEYTSVDGRIRADVYFGVILNGFNYYENISAVDEAQFLRFSLSPNVSCRHEDLDFDPESEKLIIIKVSPKKFNIINIDRNFMNKYERLLD